MKTFEIKHNQTTYNVIVDDEDYEWISTMSWHISLNGKYKYVQRLDNNERTLLHRAIMKCSNEQIIDHINRNTLDNRKENLRISDRKKNGENRNKSKNNSSGYIGVSWNKRLQKWQSYIRHNYKIIYLGVFVDIEDAVKARKQKELELDWHTNVRN